MTSPPARVPSAQNARRSTPSAVMLRRKCTEPSANSRLTPPLWLLEKSSRPPSASVRMLIQLLWTSTKHAAGAVALAHGLLVPARTTPPLGAPAQRPLTCDQARSPTITVLLVPSVM